MKNNHSNLILKSRKNDQKNSPHLFWKKSKNSGILVEEPRRHAARWSQISVITRWRISEVYGTCLNQVRATQSLVLAALAGSILATNVPPCDLIHTTFRKRTDLRAGALPGLLREAGARRGISLCCWRKNSFSGWSFSRCVSFRNVFLGFMS